jgi:hypothetical protein
LLPDDVIRFLRTSVGSLWALEQLLLLRRDRTRGWSLEELTRELRSSIGVVTSVLAQLRGAGLVTEADGLYRYCPTSADLDALVERVADSYAKFPFTVTQAILTSPNDKIQLFADAFRIKKD